MTENITLIATMTFGLEAIVKREIEDLGFKGLHACDGKVEFSATLNDIPKANLWLRCADRVLFKLAEFPAADFDQLFDQTKALPWERWIKKDAKITVTGKSVKSRLASVRSNQSIVKKAIVERLKEKYRIDWLSEAAEEYTIQISILKDSAVLTLDSSGAGLNRRGYRKTAGEVPLKETLAAALVKLTFWGRDRILIDPMCGSGTILIEAAMIARHIAPGLNRKFAAESWPFIEKKVWDETRLLARQAIKNDGPLKIIGYDIDPERVKDSRMNAKYAGVKDDIVFERKDIGDLKIEEEFGIVICNPPYGIKLPTAELSGLYDSFNTIFKEKPGWSLYILTADKDFPRYFKRAKPDRVRKLYNGTIEANYYQYYGKRPPHETSPIKVISSRS